ncbi:DUF998 domain-containing protein [Actinomadura rugatobispora]|uniref:DUF998 domain-containing protein n=1 Tax=Actinomadura rugatobispora TaxID=1994 RepID=A0ABW0ZW21_9ACTN|nr:hypothetical protein GCM10010200_096050 [Actinomadura rugatobispora]
MSRLRVGVGAAVLFACVSTIEAFARPAFDLERHAISMLSLGDRGWVMVATFIVSGLLVLEVANTLRRFRHRRWSAALIGGFGAGLILAGIFPAPRGLGFPLGTPQDLEPVMTASATMHSVAFMVAFSSLIVACFVFGGIFWREERQVIAGQCLAAGVAIPVFIALGASEKIPTGVGFYIAAMLAWLWFAGLAWNHATHGSGPAEHEPMTSPTT